MLKYVFGVDIGGTTVKMGFFMVDGTLNEKWEIPTRKDEGGKYILSDVAASIKSKVEKLSILEEEVAGIGIGVPGPVKDDGTVLRCANLGWGIFNVAEEVEKLTGFHTRAGNDANMAALGEMWKGGGAGYETIVMVTLGTGVGGGIVLNGKMIYGTNGAGGEIGHMQVNEEEEEICGCGKKGCLEQYTSATGITRMANRVLNNTDKPSKLRDIRYISAKEIFNAAKSGDELASYLVEEHGKCLGRALARIACVVDPEAFVIGGGVSKAGEIIIRTVSKYYQEYVFHACKNTKFKLATLGNDAGIYGSAKAILTKYQ